MAHPVLEVKDIDALMAGQEVLEPEKHVGLSWTQEGVKAMTVVADANVVKGLRGKRACCEQ